MRIGWVGKVVLAVVVPLVLAMGVFGIVLLDAVQDSERKRIEESLSGEVVVLALAAADWMDDEATLHERVDALARQLDARVTIIAADGRVISDSSREDLSTMENHRNRPEIREARESGKPALHARYSETVRRELLYAAAPVGGDGAVARIARDYSGVRDDLNRATQAFWLLLIATVIGGVAAAVLFARRVARPVDDLTRAAESVAAGDLSARAHPLGDDEMASLARSFNAMTERLTESLDVARSETERLSTLLDAMTEGVIAIDARERVSFVNPRAREILGLDREAVLVGRPVFELVRDPRILGVAGRAAESREPIEAEIVQEGPPRRILHLHGRPVAGRPDADTILVISDLSRMRRLERMRSDFVANVSHELRTPLASIAAAVETLEDDEARTDPESGTRFVAMIKRNVRRLESLLNDILALSRLESRPETLRFVPVDFGTLVRVSGEDLAARARAAGVRLELSGERHATVTGDAQILRRIVDNLIVNAITYTVDGGRVDVDLQCRDDVALLRVQDTGVGIPEADLDRIFERFYRVDKGRSRSAGGTGLGLAIVKHAVGLHDGEVDVQSKIGEGSAFTVRIPLTRANMAREKATDSQ